MSREYGYFLEKIKLKHLIQAIKDECINLKRMLASPVIIIKNGKGRSRSLKWGVNFCNNVREIKYYFNIWGIRKKKERRGSEKGGWKFTHFTSPGSTPEWVLSDQSSTLNHYICVMEERHIENASAALTCISLFLNMNKQYYSTILFSIFRSLS